MGWRWYQEGREVPGTSGRQGLLYDVYPGQAYVFQTQIPLPAMPGEYTLELGLLSESLTWFVDRGTPSLMLSVSVKPPSAINSSIMP